MFNNSILPLYDKRCTSIVSKHEIFLFEFSIKHNWTRACASLGKSRKSRSLPNKYPMSAHFEMCRGILLKVLFSLRPRNRNVLKGFTGRRSHISGHFKIATPAVNMSKSEIISFAYKSRSKSVYQWFISIKLDRNDPSKTAIFIQFEVSRMS